MNRSVVVLLGAGASVPAGIPAAVPMTAEMLVRAEAFNDPIIARALHAICGLLQTQAAALGTSAYRSDIERVLNAAQHLSARDDQDLAPFVATWHPAIEALEVKQPTFYDFHNLASDFSWRVGFNRMDDLSDLTRGIERGMSAFAERLAKLLTRKPTGTAFRKVSEFLSSNLVDLAWQTDAARVAYFAPMIQRARQTSLTVATLNYDNTVELAASELGVPCETGIAEWNRSGVLIEGTQPGIALIKLHGSINWFSAPTAAGGTLANCGS